MLLPTPAFFPSLPLQFHYLNFLRLFESRFWNEVGGGAIQQGATVLASLSFTTQLYNYDSDFTNLLPHG